MKAAKTSGTKGSRSQQSLFRVKGGEKRRRMKCVKKQPGTYSLSDSVFEAPLGGAWDQEEISLQQVYNEPSREHVRDLPRLAARCILRQGEDSAWTEPMDVDPEPIDMDPEPMDVDPDQMGMEPKPVDTVSEPVCLESQSVVAWRTYVVSLPFRGGSQCCSPQFFFLLSGACGF